MLGAIGIGEINQSAYFEFYLAMLLRSVFKPGETGYVDFRSRGTAVTTWLSITTERFIRLTRRMLSRTRHVDLSLGNLEQRLIPKKAASSISQQCTRSTMTYTVCTSFCGIDIVDDLSRCERIDFYKHDSWFCGRQTFAFDFIFSKFANQDRQWQKIFGSWLTRTSRL